EAPVGCLWRPGTREPFTFVLERLTLLPEGVATSRQLLASLLGYANVAAAHLEFGCRSSEPLLAEFAFGPGFVEHSACFGQLQPAFCQARLQLTSTALQRRDVCQQRRLPGCGGCEAQPQRFCRQLRVPLGVVRLYLQRV